MSPLDISSSPNQRWLAKEFASSLEQSHRSPRHDVHGYVEFANHLGETEGPEPDPAFRAALRHRLLHELIEDELLPQPDELAMRRDQRVVRRKGGSHCFERAPREPWIAAASTVLVVCGGAVGLGHDSSQALPSDALYPVKRFLEAGEMAIAGSSEGQAHELMEQATERLTEAEELATIDEVHASQALPESIVDFEEAASDAGDIVIQESQADSADPSLISEFRSFSSTSRTALDDLATKVDGETAALIDDARSTLDSIEELLPVLDTAGNVPLTSDALNILGLGGHDHGDGLSETEMDTPSADTVSSTDDRDADAAAPDVGETLAPVNDTVNDTVDGTVDGATETLAHTVSVVELSASDTVSVAVATVNNTARTVDRTVKDTVAAVNQTLDTVNKTVKQTTAAVDQTVQQTTETLQQATDAVQQTTETLRQATDAVRQTTDAVQQTTETLQQTTDAVQQTTDATAMVDDATDTLDAAQILDDGAGDTLSTLQDEDSGGLLSTN